MNYEFQNPDLLWLLLILPVLAMWYWWKRHSSQPELRFPGTTMLAHSSGNWLARFTGILPLLRTGAIALAIIGLARPRTSEQNTKSRDTEGIDIVMAVDVSASMLAKDLDPNRLEATKDVASEFIEGRPNDRIGLVVYGGESYTQTPLTSDHKILLNALDDVKYGLIKDGTAIGMGLATTVNRLKNSKAKSKVAILLTDGENNSGDIDPLTAAQLAQEFNIRVYTIGVGSRGVAPTPAAYDAQGNFIYRNRKVSIDEELLKNIARQTEGRYFRATDNEKLKEIYNEIDQLEKTKLQETKFYSYDEKFEIFVLWALGLFTLELILRYSLFKSFV